MHEAGVAYVPADRHRFGLVLTFSIADNLVLTSYYRAPYARGGLRDDDAIRGGGSRGHRADSTSATPSADVSAGTLSGGNQQKVVVAREFDRELKLLVLDQPTRGLDVGSIEFIHRQVIEKRDAGTAVLLVSAELDEVLEMSDRIAVMYRGADRRDGRRADGGQERGRPADGDRRARPRNARRRRRGRRSRMTAGADPAPARVSWRGSGRSPACPLISILLALVVGAIRHPRSRTCCCPDHASTGLPITAYAALIEGSVGSENAIVNTLVQTDAAHPRRPVGRARLQGRPVQHRRPGPVPDGRPRRRLVGVHGRRPAADRRDPGGIARGDRCGGAAWGFIPGVLKAFSGAHEVVTTIMLNYIAICRPRLGGQRAAEGAGLALADHRGRRQRRAARSSSAATATSGILIAFHGRRWSVAPVPDDARLRDPRRRRQPGRRPLRRHAPDG